MTIHLEDRTVELLHVNLNYLVRKYVDMVYAKKPIGEETLSIEEFNAFVSQHPKLINVLYKGFNHDIWGVDEKTY
jgi:hypothetical protein